ncbi:MAG: flagellar protein FlaG [Marinospirillum sp.]|uniref:flagellar protein FlaG n=1 Tax=Marinospirillum sp. TaxID=2183934 RepID=UPI0019EE9930|nr:flagellar protein FlaG [Marinospirillum sp.]MBE0507666.1 flagellar protein FlaG [Marinospirillum sp.]
MNTDFPLSNNLADKSGLSSPTQKVITPVESARPVGQVEAASQPKEEEKPVKEQPKETEQPVMDAEELRQVLDEINSALYSYNRGLRFEIHEKTDDIIVRVLNTKTDEVIRQYPSEDVLKRREQLIRGETLSLITQVD